MRKDRRSGQAERGAGHCLLTLRCLSDLFPRFRGFLSVTAFAREIFACYPRGTPLLRNEINHSQPITFSGARAVCKIDIVTWAERFAFTLSWPSDVIALAYRFAYRLSREPPPRKVRRKFFQTSDRSFRKLRLLRAGISRVERSLGSQVVAKILTCERSEIEMIAVS